MGFWFVVYLLLIAGIIPSFHMQNNFLSNSQNFDVDSEEQSFLSFEVTNDSFKQKCKNNGNSEVTITLEMAYRKFWNCFYSNFDLEYIQQEFNVARDVGTLDQVVSLFSMYCEKIPVVKLCMENTKDMIEPCLDEKDKSILSTTTNLLESVIELSCTENVDNTKLFEREKSFECIEQHNDILKGCMNRTIVATLNVFYRSMFTQSINREQCEMYNELNICVMNVLWNCRNLTLLNAAETFFNYGSKIISCNESPRRVIRNTPNETLNLDFDRVTEKYLPYCIKNSGPQAAEELSREFENLKGCQLEQHANFKIKFNETKLFPYSYLCQEFREGSYTCLKRLSDKIEVCVTKEENYASEFGLEIFDFAFEFLCKDDSRMLKKYFGESNTCTSSVQNLTSLCFERSRRISSRNREVMVTRSELCKDLVHFKECIQMISGMACPNNGNIKEFLMGLGESLYTPCNSFGTQISNYFLLINLLLVIIFNC